MPWRNVHVLLVDDDDVDVEYIMRSLRELQLPNPVTIVHNGIEAISALRGQEGYQRLPRPYIILLDLNMPRMNGLEFLHALRQDHELRRSVVFVMTTSQREEDIEAAYAEHVAGYFLKERALDKMFHLPSFLAHYCRLVQLPLQP